MKFLCAGTRVQDFMSSSPTIKNITQAAELSIEPYDPSDLDSIMAIENVSFTAPWSRASYEELAPLDSVNIWVGKIKGELVCYMLCQRVGDEMELHTIAVAPSWRQKGIGRRFMAHMIAEARRVGVSKIYLLVRPSNNAAVSLYKEHGFKGIGVRRAYYRDNGEDALVMRLELKADS